MPGLKRAKTAPSIKVSASMLNLDTKSEGSSSSRSAVSTPGRPMNRGQNVSAAEVAVLNYPDLRELKRVSSNFSLTLEAQYRFIPHIVPKLAVTGITLKRPKSAPSGQEGNRHLKPRWPKSMRAENSPMMLLPNARLRMRADFWEYVNELGKHSSVVPLDGRTSLVIEPDNFKRANYRRPKSAQSTSSHDSVTSTHTPESPSPVPLASYLESFADMDGILKQRKQIAKRRLSRSTSVTFNNKTEIYDLNNNENTQTQCPLCARLIQKYEGSPQLADWLKLDALGVHRGEYPHFCNFVQKLKLSERRPNVKQAFVDPADENDIDGNQPFGDRVQSGVSGRPSSPSSIDEVENANKSKDGFVSMDDLEEVPASDIGGDADDGKTDDTWPTTEVNQEPSEGYTVITDTISGNEGDDGGGKGADKTDEGDDDGPPIRIPTPHDEPPPEVPNDAWNDNTTNSNNDSINNRPKPKVPDLPDTSALTPSSSNRRSSRGCVKLKEKGSLVRRPSTLPKDIKPPSPVPESVSPRPPTPKTEPEKPKAVPIPEPVKATPKVPDLPDTSQTNRRRESKRGSVISKSAIAFAPRMADPKSEPDQTDDVKVRKYEYNPQDALDTEVKKPKVQPWLQGRLALSQQASRFELPMDMKTLETMKPQEYLKQFCIISTRRNTLYNKMYMKNKDKAGVLTNKGLEKALRDVLVNTITKDDLQLIYKMADILEETTVDYKLFAGIAAMSERVLYPKFVTDETVTIKDHKKEKIECADFCGLNWKFHGVNVNPPVKRILEAL